MKKQNDLYFLSEVDISDRNNELHETSFEKVTQEEYDKFLKIKKPSLNYNPSKHCYLDVELNDEWELKQITDKKMINAIKILWKHLPSHGHIEDAFEGYVETIMLSTEPYESDSETYESYSGTDESDSE